MLEASSASTQDRLLRRLVQSSTLPPSKLAVIVPAYDEASRIVPTLRRMNAYLSAQTYSWEVVVVSDGSKDKTADLVAEFSREVPGFTIDHYSSNRGKGFAVRRGVMKATADYILFSDADLATPIEEVEKLWATLDGTDDLAIGSRPLRESKLEVRQPWYRELAGRAFNLAVQTIGVPGIQDTQCGFKLFRRAVGHDIFSRSKVDRFGFDFEIMMIARDLGYRIAEVPVVWRHQEGSKVNLVKDGLDMLSHLVRLRMIGRQRRIAPNPEEVQSGAD